MYFSYPKNVDEVISSLPTNCDDCDRRMIEFSIVYQKLYIHNPDSAELLLNSASHLKYRQILLFQDHSEQSEAFVTTYETTLPRMIWKSEVRHEYLFEMDWELATSIKNGLQLSTFFEEDTDIFELQMLHLPCDTEVENMFLDRLFSNNASLVSVSSIDHINPPSESAMIRDVRHVGGKTKLRTGATELVTSLQGMELPMFGPDKYRIVQLSKVYESYAPTQLVNHDEFAVLPRISDGLGKYLSACGIPIYSGTNYSMFPLLCRFKLWKRKKRHKNIEIRTLGECAYQQMMHSWILGNLPSQ